MTVDSTPETIVRQVVRGERDISELRSAGILVLPVGDGYEIMSDDGLSVVVGPRDVAAGIASLANDPERLAEWASILLVSSVFLDLAMESEAAGEELLGALWNLSFGKPLDGAVLALARKLANHR